ncbi:MAG: hypothetical protein ACO3JL_03080, partial [Myxococcota bacterium]
MAADAASCEPMPCGEISATGRCDQGIARVCLGGTLATFDCLAQGQGCELLIEEARVGCTDCTACDGTCVDHATDSFHCGACGVECAPSGRGRCIDGECIRPTIADDGAPEGEPAPSSSDESDVSARRSSDFGCSSWQIRPRTFLFEATLISLACALSGRRRRRRSRYGTRR